MIDIIPLLCDLVNDEEKLTCSFEARSEMYRRLSRIYSGITSHHLLEIEGQPGCLLYGGKIAGVPFGVKLDVSRYLKTTRPWPEVLRMMRYILHGWSPKAQAETSYVHIYDLNMLVDGLNMPQNELWQYVPGNELFYQVCDFSPIAETALIPKSWRLSETGKQFEAVDGDNITLYRDKIRMPPTLPEQYSHRMFAAMCRLFKYPTFDTETTGLSSIRDRIVSMGFSFDTHVGFYVSNAHERPDTGRLDEWSFLRKNLFNSRRVMYDRMYPVYGRCAETAEQPAMSPVYPSEVPPNIPLESLRPFLSEHIMKSGVIGHNLKFDLGFMWAKLGIEMPAKIDTMLLHYVTRPGYDDPVRDKRGLKHIAQTELGVPDWGVDVHNYQKLNRNKAAVYNTRDCCYTTAMALKLHPLLDRDMVRKLFYDVEMPFMTVLMHAEDVGISVDKDALIAIEKDLVAKMEEIKTKLKTASENPNFNINSGPQMAELFFEKLGILPIRKCRDCVVQFQAADGKCPKCGEPTPIQRATPEGKPSLDKYAMEDLAKRFEVPLAHDVLEYRGWAKLVSSYTNMWEKADACGRLHPQYHQARTSTGRLSSSDPNFQQLPKRTAKYIRKAIVPNERGTWCLVAADYAGQENRIMAAYSNDTALIQAFNPCFMCEHNTDVVEQRCQFGKCARENHDPDSRCNVVDIHSYVAKQVFPEIDCPVDAIKDHPVFSKLREKAKGVTFAQRGPLREGNHSVNVGEIGKRPAARMRPNSERRCMPVAYYPCRDCVPTSRNTPGVGEDPVQTTNSRKAGSENYSGKLAYGGGAWGIADKMNITLDAAKELLKNYFTAFPGIKKYIEQCQQYVDEHGSITDMFGRTRRFKYAGYADPLKAGHYEQGDRKGEVAMMWNGLARVKEGFRSEVGGDRRGATNFPIQGGAATMTKVAGNNVYRMLLEEKLDADLIEFIHD